MSRSQCPLPATRAEALEALDRFLPQLSTYASRRNYVEPGHRQVSRLSAALRTRVILENEVCDAVLARFPFATAEKFLQEIHWRLYWKGWLEMRQEVWHHYQNIKPVASAPAHERAEALMRGESGVAIMDHFARELITTAYLHNHARMWFASFWIHVERLPWEWGARFFFRHLLDGDPASNTLSWRWVAGLHTPGKTYLVRRSNLERYCHPDWLRQLSRGLGALEAPSPAPLSADPLENPPPHPFPSTAVPSQWPRRWGLWIHEDDLSTERSPLSSGSPCSLRTFLSPDAWNALGYPALKQAHLARALEDGGSRAQQHFKVLGKVVAIDDLASSLRHWAAEERLEAIVALKPFAGPLSDAILPCQRALEEAGVLLHLVTRPEDQRLLPHATGGFFKFWKACRQDLS